jgi:hypothetical protein
LELIPKSKLEEALEREASDFLGAVMSLELPDPISRLSIPVLTTAEKANMEVENQNLLVNFICETMQYAPGKMVLFADFVVEFHKYLPDMELRNWSSIAISRKIPAVFPKTTNKIVKGTHTDNKRFVANVSWLKEGPPDLTATPLTTNSKGYIVTEGK